MKKILITGSSGFIGTNLLISLQSQNYVLAVIDRSYNTKFENITNYIGDICDYSFIEKTILDFQPNKVFHLAGYKNRMAKFFESNPGFRSRIAHHIDFPDYNTSELLDIAKKILEDQNYKLTEGAEKALEKYIALRREQPHFANARSVRNALDRARLRQANRLFSSSEGQLNADQLSTIDDVDILSSRVFTGGIDEN